jgi:dipeptidyl aminopeptidase/acylaminoacyl peptidase
MKLVTDPFVEIKPVHFVLLSVLLLAGCGPHEAPSEAKLASSAGSPNQPQEKPSLAEARRGFQTKLLRQAAREPVPEPPPGLFRVVHYDSPAGKLAAYLSPPPGDGKQHPAVIWLHGGFSNSIGETAWEKAPPKNDQSGSAFRKAGIPMMYPSLRGGNDNPGFKEGFFGEVDDVLAAREYLAGQDMVDPTRIYLAGHSTGATLALLTAASTDRFRAVFAFGPADDASGYSAKDLPFDTKGEREFELRSPVRWLHSVRSPVFVFEGTEQPGSLGALQRLREGASGI